jgi:predicted SAM-dependent methyltransferase
MTSTNSSHGPAAGIKKWFPPELRSAIRHARREFREYSANKRASRWFAGRLREKSPIWLELGSGSVKGKNGWNTLDGLEGADVQFDLNRPFPVPEGSVEKLHASHVLEHFFCEDLMQLLRECHRVLARGGTFSICVPDASSYIKAYTEPDCLRDYLPHLWQPALNYHTPIDYINYMAYMHGGHRHLFDQENLLAILVAAGFEDVRLREFDPALDLEFRRFESIYALARKN